MGQVGFIPHKQSVEEQNLSFDSLELIKILSWWHSKGNISTTFNSVHSYSKVWFIFYFHKNKL